MTEHEVKVIAKETAREALMEIFDVRLVTDRLDDALHAAVLRYLSRVAKAHEGTEMQNAVDKALGNALQAYCQVNKLEEQQMEQVAKKVINAVLLDAGIKDTLRKAMRSHVQEYLKEAIDRFVSSYNQTTVINDVKDAISRSLKNHLPI